MVANTSALQGDLQALSGKSEHLNFVLQSMELIAQRQKEQFSNSVTPRLQSTDVINIFLSLLLSKRVACRNPTTDLRYAGNFFMFDDILLMCTTKLLSEYCFPMSSKAITALVKLVVTF